MMPHWSYSLLWAPFIPLGMWRIYSHFLNRRRAMRRAMRAPVQLALASIWDAATNYRGAG